MQRYGVLCKNKMKNRTFCMECPNGVLDFCYPKNTEKSAVRGMPNIRK